MLKDTVLDVLQGNIGMIVLISILAIMMSFAYWGLSVAQDYTDDISDVNGSMSRIDLNTDRLSGASIKSYVLRGELVYKDGDTLTRENMSSKIDTSEWYNVSLEKLSNGAEYIEVK